MFSASSEISGVTNHTGEPRIVGILSRIFGVAFSLRETSLKQPGAQPMLDALGSEALECGVSDFPGRNLSVEQHDFAQGSVVTLPDRGVLLAVRVAGEEQGQFATALIPSATPELISSCVSVAFELADAESCNIELSNQLESYASELSDSFEEVVWNRGLSQQLEQCEVTRRLPVVAESVIPALKELIQAEAVLLIETDQADRKTVLLQQWHGPHLVTEDECRSLIDTLRPVESGEPIVLNAKRTKALSHLPQVKSLIQVDLAKDLHHYGWLFAFNRTLNDSTRSENYRKLLGSDEFGTVEASLVQTAATMLSTHTRNVQLFEEKEGLMLDVIKSLVRSLEARDQYTCGHSDRVAVLSRLLAGEMGLPETELQEIYVTGLLHDIGKVGIPDQVLNKPDRLTDEEFTIIQRHPVIGYEILKNLRQFEFVLPGVRHHHEQMDGRGYPDGLVGEEIPLVARIMAVADAYDAMTSNRPYRNGMPFEKAESILQENRGPQWDPQVLDAFFRRRDDIREICSRHRIEAVMSGLEQRESVKTSSLVESAVT